MSMQVTGLNEVLALTARAIKPTEIAKELHEIGNDLLKEASFRSPSDSGALQASGTVVNRGVTKASSTTSFGSAAVDYAPFVHFGRKRQDPQPFLGDALAEIQPKMEARLAQAARKQLGSK